MVLVLVPGRVGVLAPVEVGVLVLVLVVPVLPLPEPVSVGWWGCVVKREHVRRVNVPASPRSCQGQACTVFR